MNKSFLISILDFLKAEKWCARVQDWKQLKCWLRIFFNVLLYTELEILFE